MLRSYRAEVAEVRKCSVFWRDSAKNYFRKTSAATKQTCGGYNSTSAAAEQACGSTRPMKSRANRQLPHFRTSAHQNAHCALDAEV